MSTFKMEQEAQSSKLCAPAPSHQCNNLSMQMQEYTVRVVLIRILWTMKVIHKPKMASTHETKRIRPTDGVSCIDLAGCTVVAAWIPSTHRTRL